MKFSDQQFVILNCWIAVQANIIISTLQQVSLPQGLAKSSHFFFKFETKLTNPCIWPSLLQTEMNIESLMSLTFQFVLYRHALLANENWKLTYRGYLTQS